MWPSRLYCCRFSLVFFAVCGSTLTLKDDLDPLQSLQDLILGEEPTTSETHFDQGILTEFNSTDGSPHMTKLDMVRNRIVTEIENKRSEIGRQFSSVGFPSLEVAMLSLAFLTFAVFLIDLLQELMINSSGRGRRATTAPPSDEKVNDGAADAIVVLLSSLDTLSFGRDNPMCGQKLLCHLNRSGWHSGMLGSASNYFVSLALSLFSPASGFSGNLNAAQFGQGSEECNARFHQCPSVLGSLIVGNNKKPDTPPMTLSAIPATDDNTNITALVHNDTNTIN